MNNIKYELLGAFSTAVMLMGGVTALLYQQELLCGFIFGAGTYIVFRLGEMKGLHESTNS